jgi:putative FmdB family regulatory protein
MPVYEYECGACGGRFELMRKFSDPEVTACTLCGAEPVRKILSPTAFVLKGTGWYATDYASSTKKTESSTEKDKPAGDAKPAAAGCGSAACAGSCAAKS